jgi:hypothetical protein
MHRNAFFALCIQFLHLLVTFPLSGQRIILITLTSDILSVSFAFTLSKYIVLTIDWTTGVRSPAEAKDFFL